MWNLNFFRRLFGRKKEPVIEPVEPAKIIPMEPVKPIIKDIIKPEMLQHIVPGMKEEKAKELSTAINKLAKEYKMDKPEILAHFISQMALESQGFNRKEESMNYSAKRMMEVWPSRFKTLAAAQPYANNPVKLANHVYGMRMGNVNANDGWLFRGSGYKQLTGRFNHTNYWNAKGKPTATVDEFAGLLRTDEYWAMDSAFWFWSTNNLSALVGNTKDDVLAITKRINGGVTSLADRRVYYKRAKEVIK